MDGAYFFGTAERLQRCRTLEQLERVCADFATALDAEHYLFGAYYPIVGHIVMFTNHPDEWRRRYDEEGYLGADPVVTHCWTHSAPLQWDEIRYTRREADVRARRVMREAGEFGLRSGISLPTHGAGAEGGTLTLCSPERQRPFDTTARFGLQMVSQTMHEAVKDIASRTMKTVPPSRPLTAREKECLTWTASGKTSWEISRILRVSESTVTFHLRNAIAKMEVTNRSQAVAKALVHSRITPF